MNIFSLNSYKSTELESFKHIAEFSKSKIQSVHTLNTAANIGGGLRFVFVLEGKFEWLLDAKEITVYPNDLVIIKPHLAISNKPGYFENGTFYSFTLLQSEPHALGNWSHFSKGEQVLICKLLSINQKYVLSNQKNLMEIFKKLEVEIFTTEIGYKTRVNELIDELVILIVRQLNKHDNEKRDFPQTFQKFDEILRANLAHPWTVEEMAAIMGVGTTAFNEKMKAYSGFSPVNYLINLRITEAIKILKSEKVSLTDIAIGLGFYSSQHFSTTFKKLTGYTPGYFRKSE